MTEFPAPPSGYPPPDSAVSPSGDVLDLAAVARAACALYAVEFPDERERYGPAGVLWCEHDLRHLLNWSVLSLTHSLDLERQLVWLARVLEARDFPLPRLVRGLEILSSTVLAEYPGEGDVAARVAQAAAFVAGRPTFLAD